MTKIAIIGGSGAGKSTLAGRLSQQLGLTVHHIDKMYWKPNWVKRDEAEFLALAKEVVDQESWIFDGFPAQFWQSHGPALDMVILVDTNYFVRFWRVINRDMKDSKNPRADGPENCSGIFRREFFRQWLFGWHRHAGRRCRKVLHNAPENVAKMHLKSARAADDFIAGFRENPAFGLATARVTSQNPQC